MHFVCFFSPFFSFLSPSSNKPGRCMTTPLPTRAEDKEYVDSAALILLRMLSLPGWNFKPLPMSDVLLGLMIPLGRRWKSYSLPSTTTVCPALLPPCKSKQGTYYGRVMGHTVGVLVAISSKHGVMWTPKTTTEESATNTPSQFAELFQHLF